MESSLNSSDMMINRVVYREISEDIVYAKFRKTEDGLLMMIGEPIDVTESCLHAVAKDMLELNRKKGMDHIVTIDGQDYRLSIHRYNGE